MYIVHNCDIRKSKHAETREQSQASSSLLFFIVVDGPIQRSTSGILSLCFIASKQLCRATTTVKLENTYFKTNSTKGQERKA